MFSIIIPTLNEEKYLPKLLNNLAEQTYREFEVIHIDANSADKTVEIASSFKKQLNLRTLTVDVRSPSFQRNVGAGQAKNPWLLFMDADIRLEKDFLEKLSAEISRSKADFFSTNDKPYPPKIIYTLMLVAVFWYSKIMEHTAKPFVTEGLFGCNREKFNLLGGFDTSLRVNEGSEFMERGVAQGYKFRVFDKLFFTMHMRRIEKRGSLKSVVDQAQVGLAHLLGVRLSSEKQNKLYPMDDRYR